MTYLHAKVLGQQSVGSKDRVETNERTDGGDCITSHANAVGKYAFLCLEPRETVNSVLKFQFFVPETAVTVLRSDVTKVAKQLTFDPGLSVVGAVT